jgi:hypothetical protein
MLQIHPNARTTTAVRDEHELMQTKGEHCCDEKSLAETEQLSQDGEMMSEPATGAPMLG